MPVVGRGNGDGVDVFGLEGLAEVAHGGGSVAESLLGIGGKFGADVVIRVADVSNARDLLIGLQARKDGRARAR